MCSSDLPLRFQAVALDIRGRPLPGTPVAVTGTLVKTTYSQRRTADGLVHYDRKDETFQLGTLCSGTADQVMPESSDRNRPRSQVPAKML